jgi:hypothetical protein
VRGNFTWLLGVAALILIVAVILNGIKTEGPGSRGVPVGEMLPPFAAPLALSSVEADANVARSDGSGSSGKRAACKVRGPEILNVCALYEEGPVALAFFATKSSRCEDQVSVLDRVSRTVPGVRAAAVAIKGSHDEVGTAVRERGWKLPVGWDRDGAVANLYAVAVCPTITFASEGGKVVETALEFLDEARLRAKLEALR